MANAPDTSTYILVTGDPSLPNNRVLAVDLGLGLNDDGTYITITPENTLGALQELSGTGIVVMTGTDSAETRSITSSGSISITNPAGVGGNIVLDVAASSSLQLINILSGGVSVGNTSKLNLIPGTGAGISCVTNGDRIDCTITANSDASILAPYWVSTDTPSLSNQVNIGALTSGLLKISVSGGVATPSTATTIYTTDNNFFVGDNVGGMSGNFTLTGDNNIGVGSTVLNALTTGQQNTAIGSFVLNLITAGAGNTAMGYNTGSSQLSYLNCSFFGSGADSTKANTVGSSAIGAASRVSQDYTMSFGSNLDATFYVFGHTEGEFFMNLRSDTGGSPCIFMSTTAAPPAPTDQAGGVYSVLTGDIPYFTSYTSDNSGQLITAVDGTAVVGQAQSLLVGNGNNYSGLIKGSANQVLKMDGTGTNITWASDTGTVVSSGTATLTAGSSGAIALSGITGTSKVVVSYVGTTTDPGILSVTLGTDEFTIVSSSATDVSSVAWHAIP